eukprot:s2526_g31.t1
MVAGYERKLEVELGDKQCVAVGDPCLGMAERNFVMAMFNDVQCNFFGVRSVACPCGLSALRQGDGPEHIKKQVNATKTKPVQKEN